MMASVSSNATPAHRVPVKLAWRNPVQLSGSSFGNAQNLNSATWMCGTSCS